eukprot:2911174-Prymnesium_polylepis.1
MPARALRTSFIAFIRLRSCAANYGFTRFGRCGRRPARRGHALPSTGLHLCTPRLSAEGQR